MTFFELIGLTGFVSYLLSYGLLQTGKIAGDSLTYVVANMISASLVLVSLTESFNLASALIQIAWILISLVGITRIVMHKRTKTEKPLQRSPMLLSKVDHQLR